MASEIKLPWCPAYEFPDRAVSMEISVAQTFLSDRRVGLQLYGGRLERPACFWIDKDQVYLRANWGEWFPVSASDPAHISALISARYCRVISSYESEMLEEVATIRHVESLPRLFKEEPELTSEPEPQPDPSPENQSEIDLIAKAAEEVSLNAFPQVRLGKVTVDMSVSNDDTALLLRVVPRDAGVLSPEEIRTAIDVLCDARRELLELEESATVMIGVIASPDVLRGVADVKSEAGEVADDLHLLEYDGLPARLRELFPPEDSENNEED